MTHPNANLLRNAYDAFARGDLDAAVADFTDDVMFNIPGKSPLAGEYRGKEQVIAYLTARADAGAAPLDPVGELNLKLAKKVRRRALSDHSVDQPGVLTEMADAFFPFPDGSLRFWPEVRDPAFKAGVSARQSESARDPDALGRS